MAIVPPQLTPWQPGESGNPKGRPSVGLTLLEWLNSLAAMNLTEKELRAVARDKSLPQLKRAAALRLVRLTEDGDMADMEPVLDGQMSLRELRAQGIATSAVKKLKRKNTTDAAGKESSEVELELHDRSGAEFDRALDRTVGKAVQSLQVNANIQLQAVTVEFVGSELPAPSTPLLTAETLTPIIDAISPLMPILPNSKPNNPDDDSGYQANNEGEHSSDGDTGDDSGPAATD